jgi:hypothetical protein
MPILYTMDKYVARHTLPEKIYHCSTSTSGIPISATLANLAPNNHILASSMASHFKIPIDYDLWQSMPQISTKMHKWVMTATLRRNLLQPQTPRRIVE